MKLCNTIQDAISYSFSYLLNTGKVVNAKSWQGIEAPKPMFEAMDLAFKCPIPQTQTLATTEIKPNMDWAEVHFQERVSGKPLNPPPSHNEWPFGQKNNEKFTEQEKFDHTYPERFWPKFAGEFSGGTNDGIRPLEGIRFQYGDLTDVIDQLNTDDLTRQAYLPIFFPEDTGAKGGKKRVPCTLGYHFVIRDGYLHLTYLMRSCDALRHFRDDLYMAVRLAQHICRKLNYEYSKRTQLIIPGMLKFYATSYHIFEDEQKLLNKNI